MTKDVRIYIVGEVTGHIEREGIEAVKAKFKKVADKISKLGFVAVDPMRLGIPPKATRKEAEPTCLNALDKCHGMFVMDDWKKGKLTYKEVEHFRATNEGQYIFWEESKDDVWEFLERYAMMAHIHPHPDKPFFFVDAHCVTTLV